jgi:type II secretory pathway component PulK
MRSISRIRHTAATQRGQALLQALIVAAVALAVIAAALATSFNDH